MMPIVKRKFCPSLLIFSGLAGQVSYDLKLAVTSSSTGKVQSKINFPLTSRSAKTCLLSEVCVSNSHLQTFLLFVHH